jgi:hypothetical protein
MHTSGGEKIIPIKRKKKSGLKSIENCDLELATLKQILHELEKRRYKFLFASDCPNGKDIKIYLGTGDLISPLRLMGETAELLLGISKKCNGGVEDAFTRTLTLIMLQVELLLGDIDDSSQEEPISY